MGGAGQVREPRGGPYPPRPPTQTTQHREKAGLCTPGHTSLPPAWHDTGWSLPCVSAFLIFTEVGDSKGRSLVGPCTEPRAPSWRHRLPIQVHPSPWTGLDGAPGWGPPGPLSRLCGSRCYFGSTGVACTRSQSPRELARLGATGWKAVMREDRIDQRSKLGFAKSIHQLGKCPLNTPPRSSP